MSIAYFPRNGKCKKKKYINFKHQCCVIPNKCNRTHGVYLILDNDDILTSVANSY